ncbi:hypothetical protein A343_0181 [Porphyromonas gingivalis JCVI SC001]|nr:hypothetical protein A343_0184 [Porphyromonas gingivalis JCVI SC001]EOA10616.1 hypothetical protein A343_0181 [Porphyromonas gingivalis JCVI SC001]
MPSHHLMTSDIIFEDRNVIAPEIDKDNVIRPTIYPIK